MHLPPCSTCCTCVVSFRYFFFLSFFLLFRVHKNLLLLNNHSLTTLHVGQWFAQSTQHAPHIETVRQTVHMFWWSRSSHWFFFLWPEFSGRRYRYLFAGECRFHHTTKDIKIFRWKICAWTLNLTRWSGEKKKTRKNLCTTNCIIKMLIIIVIWR